MAHHHLCVECHKQQVPCDGVWERNWDGFPETICTSYHLLNGELNPDCLCIACDVKRSDEINAALDWEMSRS